MDCQVIVVGAGLSGLSAAKLLKEAGVSVIVLEATERVGGRTFTIKDPEVKYVDIGGSYFGPTQDCLLRLSKELGVENFKVNDSGDELHYKNGTRTRFPSWALPGRWNPCINMDINNILWLIDEMGKEIPADGPWNSPKAEEWDTMTFKEFLQKHCWTKGAIEYLKNYVNINITSEPYEASLLSFLWYIKQCGGTKRIFSTTNGAQERKFVGGSQQISEKMAEILGSTVLISTPVVGINQKSKDEIILKILNGNEMKTQYIILALPPAMQMKIHFEPPLPPLRNQLMQRLPMGTVMKIIIYYPTAFWTKKGLSGTIFTEGDDRHPIFLTMDDTSPGGKYAALVGFIIADKCRRLFCISPSERKELISKSLAEATGCDEALKPIYYVEKNWMEDQYVGGGYTAMYPPGFLTRYGKIIRDPVDRLYFAGTETAINWSGYMEGAIQAGERAAREILCKMGKITPDQIWQKEPQSQDVKPEPFDVTFAERFTPSVPGFLKLVALATAFSITVIVFVKRPVHFS